jgi:hypothetical protein
LYLARNCWTLWIRGSTKNFLFEQLTLKPNIMFGFENYVTYIMSKFPNRQLVTLQGKLNNLKRKIIYIFISFIILFNITNYKSSADFSGWFSQERKSSKTLIKSLQNLYFLNLFLGEGVLHLGSPRPKLFLFMCPH